MVKKLISGLLKKKDKADPKEEAKPAEEDVPDELPPLAEDVVEKAEEPKEKEGAEKAGEEEKKAGEEKPAEKPAEEGTVSDLEDKPPEDLPPLDAEGEEKKEEAKEKPAEEGKEGGLPDEIKKAKAAKAKKEEPKEKEEADEDIKEKKFEIPREKLEPVSEVGFFSNLLEQIKKHEGFKERLLSGDLFSRMNNYWELKKHEIKTGTSAPAEKKLENDLIKGLEDLKILEQKWQVQKLALEEDLNFLHQREMEIQTKVENLKRISNELSLFKNVKPDQYFHLHNGVVLKNLHDLIDVLEIIDDETFNHHVSGEKNDFSDWIMHVIKSRSLAEKIKKARTKEEMIEVLETEPAVMKDLKSKTKKHLPPKKYFWLSNGIVIKSLYELLDALKAMEQELFEEHVNKEKNDFSNWVMHTLKNKNLAEKLEKAKTRKEMVDILEIFL